EKKDGRSSEPSVDDQPDDGDEMAGLSPFEIDDESEDWKGEDVESSEDEESVVSQDEKEEERSAPMSILDLARKSRQSARAGSDDNELKVHSLDDEEKSKSEDIDEESVVPLSLGEADDSVDGQDEAKGKSVSEVILSAAAGEGGDQE